MKLVGRNLNGLTGLDECSELVGLDLPIKQLIVSDE